MRRCGGTPTATSSRFVHACAAPALVSRAGLGRASRAFTKAATADCRRMGAPCCTIRGRTTGMGRTRTGPRCRQKREHLFFTTCRSVFAAHAQGSYTMAALHARGPHPSANGCCRGNPPSIVHRVDVIGISCYTSTDLVHWRYEGKRALPSLLCRGPMHHLRCSWYTQHIPP